jgi:hypothetical protein
MLHLPTEGCRLGVATLFFASIIMALFYYILYAFVDPQLVDQAAALAEEASLQMD